ncbi:MAG TPA: DUF5666 domain-containing protein [Candidatus Paceibacterota bacterium]|nr:DUF5666 domain-containing protein [Candidatus Paceibacterota bacterium]
MLTNKKVVVPLAALALVISAGGGAVAIAKADTTNSSTSVSGAAHPPMERPTAIGKVTAVSGTTLTVEDMKGSTTYTVDASGATVTKHNPPATQGGEPTDTTVAVSTIQVGDVVAVHGTANGTQITATTIDVGMFGRPGKGGMMPGVRGKVTAVNGTTVTVTGDNGTTYTVDASGATASKMETISVSDIQVGDSVGIDGTVSGTDVSAKRIMDGIPAGQK